MARPASTPRHSSGKPWRAPSPIRQELGITGAAQPADVWRLLELQGATLRLRGADVDDGSCLYWGNGSKSITLPEVPRSLEVDAEELLLMVGFALCAGPEQLTRPVALAFAAAFRTGEPGC